MTGPYFRVDLGKPSGHPSFLGLNTERGVDCTQNPRQLIRVFFLSSRGRKTCRWGEHTPEFLFAETGHCSAFPLAFCTRGSGPCRVVGAQRSGCEVSRGRSTSHVCLYRSCEHVSAVSPYEISLPPKKAFPN